MKIRTVLSFLLGAVLVLGVALTQPPSRAAVMVATGQALGQTTAAVLAFRAVRRRLPGMDLRGVAVTLGKVAAELAYGEGLQAHARSAELRIKPTTP